MKKIGWFAFIALEIALLVLLLQRAHNMVSSTHEVVQVPLTGILLYLVATLIVICTIAYGALRLREWIDQRGV